ncbi:MAG: hypothetical protein IKQ72_04950 [Bacteroidaceae bacterium]|nr:hypothetical protein [Bacteroidaceae bacterium]
MKKVFLALFAGTLTLASCMNDWDTEMVDNDLYSAENIGEPTTTLSKLRKDYASVIEGQSYTLVNKDEIVEGIVVANDISGNIYQSIFIQGVAKDGTLDTSEGGFGVSIKGIGCLYAIYPVGQKVRINLKDLYVGSYGKSPRIGMPYVNTNGALKLGPMTFPMMQSHIQKIGKPNVNMVQAREITADDLSANNIDKITPMLVVMKNVTISDAGWPYAHWEAGGDVYSEYHDITIGGVKKSQLLYTSTSSTFAGDTIKPGKKTIYGLLNRYTSSYQLSLRSIDDIIELGE